jgi:hypothetical protein
MRQLETKQEKNRMKKLTWLLRVVGVIQIVLGVLYLFAPDFLLSSMGHSVPQDDLNYPLAMLAARFIAYGVAFFIIAPKPGEYHLWINIMILIQCIDLCAGLYYTLIGVVDLSLSGFPMFNALWITALLLAWRPRLVEVEA